MNIRFHSISFLLAIILLMMAGVGCVETLRPDESDKRNKLELPIKIFLPDDGFPTTKVEPGNVLANREENAIHDLQVWMFTHPSANMNPDDIDNEGAVAYLGVTDLDEATGFFEKNMPIPVYVMSRDVLKFDFYVLANGNSAGFNFDDPTLRNMKRKELKNKMLEGADECGFGRKMVDQMPQGGLPMSCFFNNEGQGFDLSFLNLGFSGAQMKAIKDLAVAGTDYSSQQATDMHLSEAQTEYITRHCLIEGKWNWAAFSPQISVSRSVSKLRFVFAKAMGMTGTEITRIELVDDDGTTPTGVIPVSTFLFPREDDDDPASTIPERVAYEVMSWGSPLLEDTDIKDDNNPLRLRSSSNVDMTAQEYESFLTAWVYEEGKEKPSTQKVIYLRESDQLIKGKIHYKVNGKTADVPATFSMETGSSFLRNHAWTIFAYFTSYGLNIEITTVPWTGTGDNGHHLKK